jgi:hypothetical protein
MVTVWKSPDQLAITCDILMNKTGIDSVLVAFLLSILDVKVFDNML